MVTAEDDVVVADRVVEEVIGTYIPVFRLDNYLRAAEIVLVLIAQQLRLAAECAGNIA